MKPENVMHMYIYVTLGVWKAVWKAVRKVMY